MPRPKVKDQDRQRAPTACVPCKHAKIRCDARLPCATCVRKGRTATCRYQASNRFRKSSVGATTQSSPPQAPATTDTSCTTFIAVQGSTKIDTNDFFYPGQTTHQGYRHNQQNDPDDTLISSRTSTDRSPEATQSRLLLNSKGERVYIGEMASLSFLQFLRRTLKFHMGASSFTEPTTKNVMLEVEMMDDAADASVPEPTMAEKQELIQCFWGATAGIFELYAPDWLGNLPNLNAAGDSSAEMLLALAIGAQARASPAGLLYASKCFRRARNIAFEDMLSNPNVDMIKIFLSMAYYMLGACRRNAAFMYLGVAAKAACALGLHTKDYDSKMSDETRWTRKRVWKSLFVLDTIVSSILGRPSSLPVQEVENAPGSEETDRRGGHLELALDACYGASTYLSSLIQHTPGKNNATMDGTEQLLTRLKAWGQNLDPKLRQLTLVGNDRTIPSGNAHLGCIYYFTIMLATRPFLISHLITKLQKDSTAPTSLADRNLSSDKVASLAQVCLDSAMCVAQLTSKVLQQGGFLGNMCLIKAFVFAAGLLIGFSLFATDTADLEAQAALQGAQSVLLHISHFSPQAKHYHEILTDFSQAIDKYHQQKVKRKRRDTNQYVDHIFDLSNELPMPQISLDVNPQCQYLSPASGNSNTAGMSVHDPSLTEDMPIAFDDEFDFNAMMESYDPGDLPLVWDDFGLV